MKKNNKAFTLVELIITILILSILATIAFISIQWYSQSSRDSARISDLSQIKTSLELAQIESGKYPLPTDPIDIVYSGSIVWKQGTFWESTYTNVEKLDKVPKDPLTDSIYTYSVTSKRNEYELAWIMEADSIVMNKKINQEVNAAWSVEAKAYVTWNYNSLMSKSYSWLTCFVLSLPTIIANDVETSNQVVDIVQNNRLVYSWYKNLPSSYRTTKFKFDWWFEFTTNDLLSYKWDCSKIDSDLWEKIKLIAWLQLWYSWTIFDPRVSIWDSKWIPEWWWWNKFAELYNIYLWWNIKDVLTYINTPNSWPMSLTGVLALSWSTFKPDTTTIKNIELFFNNVLNANWWWSTSNTTLNTYTSQSVKSCGVKYFDIWKNVTETELAKYHDGWNYPDANIRLWNRIAAANRYCSIYGCNTNAQNCTWNLPWKWFNGWWTYLPWTNQVMCVWWSDTKDGELRVISTWAMNLWDIATTDAACKTECTNAWFDNGVSVERNTSNIWCSCWDSCFTCKEEVNNPLFLWVVPYCNAGVVSTNKNHLNCRTEFIWYSYISWDTPLYVWTKPYCNAWVLTTNPNHLNCSTQFVWYARSTWDVALYVGTQAWCNAWVVSTNPNHLNCTTAPIWYVKKDRVCSIWNTTPPITCNYWETKTYWQCIDPDWSKVSLLLRMNYLNSTTNFIDEKWVNTITRGWNPYLSSSKSMFDTSSWYFPWAASYLTFPYNASLYDFSTSDFTIEWWVNVSSYVWGSLYGTIFSKRSAWADFDYTLYVSWWSYKLFDFAYWTTSVWRSDMNTWINSAQLNTWYHIAITRSWNTLRMFLDWNLVSTRTLTENLRNRATAPEMWKSLSYSDSYFNWYIDEFRVTKWLARYTSNFPVPVRHYATNTYTVPWWYFSWAWDVSDPWKKADGTSLKNCQEYALQATTLTTWLSRWSWTCWDGTQECLSDGIYSIDPDGAGGAIAFPVFCWMTTTIDWKKWWWTLIATKSNTVVAETNNNISNWWTNLTDPLANADNLYKWNWSNLWYTYLVYDIAGYTDKLIFDMTAKDNVTKDYPRDAIFIKYWVSYDNWKTLTCKNLKNWVTYTHCWSTSSQWRYTWWWLVWDAWYWWCWLYDSYASYTTSACWDWNPSSWCYYPYASNNIQWWWNCWTSSRANKSRMWLR